MRRKLAPATTLALVAVLAIASVAASRATTTVEVDDDVFRPRQVKIEKNDRIAFDWVGSNSHTVTKAKGPGKQFDSGPIRGSGVEYKRKFSERGTYKLICTLHEGMRMKVEVK